MLDEVRNAVVQRSKSQMQEVPWGRVLSLGLGARGFEFGDPLKGS